MKQLHVATDFYDEVYCNQRFYERHHIEALMAYCRSLDATTIDWILDDVWTLYEDYPGGMDLLQTAIDAAHNQHLEFHVVYKPFEGALAHLVLPQSMPRPAGSIIYEDLRGLIPIVRPFVAQHPEMCMQRRPGAEDPGGNVREIRLLKEDDGQPLGLKPEQISIWTGSVNGRFSRYEKPFTLEESQGWRPHFSIRPLSALGLSCRILSIKGLAIPEKERYLEVRFAEGALPKAFVNEAVHLVELAGDGGRFIPSTPATAPRLGPWCLHQLRKPFMSRLVRYARLPEVAKVLADEERVAEYSGEMRGYADEGAYSQVYRLDEHGRIAVARGKPGFLPGILNPIYPEVREEWLRITRYCIERGADAVNFRPNFHLSPQEIGEYGFNEAVIAKIGGSTNLAEIARVTGDAYTQFLRAARSLLHANGRKIGVHLAANCLRLSDQGNRPPILENMEHQWELWVREIADFAEFRGAMGLRPWSLRQVVDRLGLACRAAGIPLTYQCNRRIFDGFFTKDFKIVDDKRSQLEWEMEFALAHPDITAYQLYETALYTRLDDKGLFEGSAGLADILRRFGFGQA